MHPPAAADKIPIEKRSMMIRSTDTFVHAKKIHMTEEHKFDATSIIRFPRYCDIHPPMRNPMMEPKYSAAPGNTPFSHKIFSSKYFKL